tara:strand:- start:1732 stop:1932 length:201 start_codon:yes stop_codon:yes gene_type:complete
MINEKDELAKSFQQNLQKSLKMMNDLILELNQKVQDREGFDSINSLIKDLSQQLEDLKRLDTLEEE